MSRLMAIICAVGQLPYLSKFPQQLRRNRKPKRLVQWFAEAGRDT